MSITSVCDVADDLCSVSKKSTAFWKIDYRYASYKKLFQELKNGIENKILVGQAVFKL